MQSWPEASDLSVRIAEVRAVGAALDEARLQSIAVDRHGADVAARTHWRSEAMDAFEKQVADWRHGLADLTAALARARDEVDGLLDEMVRTDLLRAAGPGMVAAR